MDDIPANYEVLGIFQPAEAQRLLAALDAAGIPVRVEGDGYSGLEVAFDGSRRSEVNSVQTEMFGTALPNITDRIAAEEDWLDPAGLEEVRIFEHRAELAHQQAEVSGQLEYLLDEVAEVEKELREGTQSPARLEALRKANERNKADAARLTAEKNRLNQELLGVDNQICGPQSKQSAGTEQDLTNTA